MLTEEATEDSIIVIDSDDEKSNHQSLVSNYFRSVKKSAKNLGFADKKFDLLEQTNEDLSDGLSTKTPEHVIDNNLPGMSFIGSPADDDFFQEFDLSSDSDGKQPKKIVDSESDSDLDVPLSKRIAWKGDPEKHESVTASKSSDISVIAVDDDSESVQFASVVTNEVSNDCFCVGEMVAYNFTALTRNAAGSSKTFEIPKDTEIVIRKDENKKASSPKKKSKNEKSKAPRVPNRQKTKKKGEENCENASQQFKKYKNIEEALKECVAVIHNNLCQKYFRKDELTAAFHEKGVFELTTVPLADDCVVWKRKVNRAVDETVTDENSVQSCHTSTYDDENHMLLVLNVDTVREMVNAFLGTDTGSLIDLVKEAFEQFGKNVTLVFYGLETYYRRIINNENKKFRNGVFADQKQKVNRKKRESVPPLRREDVEEMIVCMQITLSQPRYNKLRVTVRNVESPMELAEMIFLYTRAIAGKPLKENRLNEHGFAWHVTSDNGSVNIKSSEDITKLWTQQLMQFPKISSDIANSISTKFPSLFSLASKYREINNTNGQSLLSDIKIVRRGEVTNRKVGAELSKRIYTYMTCSDPNVLLNS